jgi:transposase
VRDLPCFEYRTTVVVELYRVRCPDCGIKSEKVPQLPSKAPFSKRFEEAVGLACESAAVRRVARAFGLSASTVRAIDLRYLKRWAAGRRKPGLRQMGVDEIYLGKKQKFLTVVSNLESGEPLWFGQQHVTVGTEKISLPRKQRLPRIRDSVRRASGLVQIAISSSTLYTTQGRGRKPEE